MMNKINISDKLTKIYDAIYIEMLHLYSSIKIYEQLYGSGQETLDLLNDSANSFFAEVQRTFSNDIVLTINRLLDKRKESLKLDDILNNVNKTEHGRIWQQLKNILDDLKKTYKPLQNMRYEDIAHKNRNKTINLKSGTYYLINKNIIDELTSKIRSFMTIFEEYFFGHQTGYKHIFLNGDGNNLISILKKAKAYNKLIVDRIIQP